MSFNLTFIGQMIAFVIFVVLTMRFIWRPITDAMAEREKRIADGLDAASRAERDLELAREHAAHQLGEAKEQAAQLIEQANRRGQQIVEEAKERARVEGERLKAAAQAEIEQEINRARENLRADVASLALEGAEKVLESSLDAARHQQLLDKLTARL